MKFTTAVGATAYTHQYWHTTTSSVTAAQSTALATLIRTAWTTNFQAQQHVNWSLVSTTVMDLGPTPDLPGVDAVAVAGTLAGTPITAETCMLITMQIGRRYRGGHPRMYLPLGGAASILDQTHWTTTFQSTIQTKWAAFYNAVIAGGAGTPTLDYQANVSYYSGKVLRTTPVIDKVLGWTIQQVPGSQRRRMGR